MGRRARGWRITVSLFGGAALACAPGESVAVPGEPAPAPGESIDVPDAAQPDTATTSAVPPELQGVVQPWQRVDPAWLARASVWVIARYTSDTYPCRPGPDGSLDMILRDAFAPTRVLRGVVKAPSIDLDLMALRGPEFPAAPGEGRSYLLLLRPNAETAARLADPAGQLNMHERLGADQVVAIIDLSQSADEVAAE